VNGGWVLIPYPRRIRRPSELRMQVPTITIFVRHGSGCAHRSDEFFKRCQCRKHLRWSDETGQQRRSAKSRSWAAAERLKREIELQLEEGCQPDPESHAPVAIGEAIETFLRAKQGENISSGVIAKYRRELGRLRAFLEKQNCFSIRAVTLPILTDYRCTWQSVYRNRRTQ